jgi:hypothetical protein
MESASRRENRRPADPDGRLGLSVPKGRDLRHPVGAVFVLQHIESPGPAADAKVDIDISMVSRGIAEALKQTHGESGQGGARKA